MEIPRQILRKPPSENYHQLDIEARDRLFELDEQRRLTGHNSVACINSKKLLGVDMTTQTDFDNLQEISKPPEDSPDPQEASKPALISPESKRRPG
jgi:hypothetical protein